MKTARSEKYDWSFFNIMHEKLKYLLFASTTWPDAITLPDMKNFKCPGGFDKKNSYIPSSHNQGQQNQRETKPHFLQIF